MTPPQHSVTAKIEYVSKDERNWDYERFIEEAKKLGDDESHPLGYYWAGHSRYDLDAPLRLGEETVTAREYLSDDPVIWTLRRLGFRRMAMLHDLVNSGRGAQAQLDAFTEGVLDCTHATIEHDRKKKLSEDCLERLADEFGILTLLAVGDGVMVAAQRPRQSEKKA